MNKDIMLDFICCPYCFSDLKYGNDMLLCLKCSRRFSNQDGIPKLIKTLDKDIKASLKKWEIFFHKHLVSGDYLKEYEYYLDKYHKDIYRQVSNSTRKPNPVYLEIGSGTFFLGQSLSKKCEYVIGIDYCRNALLIAKKMLDEKKIKNYLLIQADILNMPLKNNTVDLIYGGGVIEHFKDTEKSLNELYRVLKKKGISFNTVPYLNIGSLTYRQVWGNIPDFPILKNIAEFIHIKILGARHMTYGYELSFTKRKLIKLHKKVGFKEIKVDKLEVFLYFEFIPKLIRGPFIWLANNFSFFWPMVKIIAKK